jgi:hypothetical protein
MQVNLYRYFMIASTYNIGIHVFVLIYYNYLLIKVRIVKILVLSIVSLLLAVSKKFSSDFKVCFHILQSTQFD